MAPFPAAYKNVVAVTATDADDRLYDSANIGNYVAVAAPGVRVYLPTVHGGYAYETGTSFSAAFVSGVAALALQHRPPLTPAALRNLLTTTAHPLGGEGDAAEFGAGLVDARRALAEELAGLNARPAPRASGKSIELPRGIAKDHRLPIPLLP